MYNIYGLFCSVWVVKLSLSSFAVQPTWMTAATCSGAVDLLQMACGILATVSSTNTVQSKFEFTHFMQRIYVPDVRMYTATRQTVIVAGRLCTICVPWRVALYLKTSVARGRFPYIYSEFPLPNAHCTLHSLTWLFVPSFVPSFLPLFLPSFVRSFVPSFIARCTHLHDYPWWGCVHLSQTAVVELPMLGIVVGKTVNAFMPAPLQHSFVPSFVCL